MPDPRPPMSIVEATRAEIDRTEQDRSERIAEVERFYDEQLERLNDILSAAEAHERASETPEPAAPEAIHQHPKPSPAAKASSNGGKTQEIERRDAGDDPTGVKALSEEREMKVLALAEQRGAQGFAGPELELSPVRLGTNIRRDVCTKLVKAGELFAIGEKRNRRYYLPAFAEHARKAAAARAAPKAEARPRPGRAEYPVPPPHPTSLIDDDEPERQLLTGSIPGDGSTLQGRICARLQGLPQTLRSLVDELTNDEEAEIRDALGLLTREGTVRPRVKNGQVRYQLAST